MLDILQLIPSRSKKSASGWHQFNGPCCIHNGETQDKRKRAGVIIDADGWSYHCFNCNFKARHSNGKLLSANVRKILGWLGLDEHELNKINLDSLRNRTLTEVNSDNVVAKQIALLRKQKFDQQTLPEGARDINENDTKYIAYLQDRGLDYKDYNFKITPNDIARKKNRIIVPYMYRRKVVGWTSRFLDDRKPKYLNEHQQKGYVFGLDMQEPDWKYVIVAEGIFDAISINGLAVLHNEFTEHQLALIKRLDKEVIVVPDQDKAGLHLAKQAIQEGFSVSTPKWDDNIHDINEAVQKYGKAGTLLSILQAKESNKIKITVELNKLKARKHID